MQRSNWRISELSQENAYILRLAAEVSKDEFFIGLRCLDSELSWMDGTPLDYTNFGGALRFLLKFLERVEAREIAAPNMFSETEFEED